LKKGDLGGFKNHQSEGIFSKRSNYGDSARPGSFSELNSRGGGSTENGKRKTENFSGQD
jgi:hypothetical protein